MSVTLNRVEPASWEGDGPAYDVLVDGRVAGHVARQRHVERTTYVGTRIGYDRTHSCWWGERSNPTGFNESLRCYRTRGEIVSIITKENQ